MLVPRQSTRGTRFSSYRCISGSGTGGQDHLHDCRGIGSQDSAKRPRLVFPRRKGSAEGRTITEGHRQVAHGGEPAVVQQGPKSGRRAQAAALQPETYSPIACFVGRRLRVSDGRLGRRARDLFACDMKYVVLQSEVDLVQDAPRGVVVDEATVVETRSSSDSLID